MDAMSILLQNRILPKYLFYHASPPTDAGAAGRGNLSTALFV
jgi:hypothetical protein